MSNTNNPQRPDKYDIELPQSTVDSFARFLVPEIRKYYDSEQGQLEFSEWNAQQEVVKPAAPKSPKREK